MCDVDLWHNKSFPQLNFISNINYTEKTPTGIKNRKNIKNIYIHVLYIKIVIKNTIQ